MNVREHLMLRLWRVAPNVKWGYLQLLAVALDGAATVELLILIAEALHDDATEERLQGLTGRAHELDALADLVGREVAWRSPTLSLPRRT